ncbi:MAG: TraR/DksA family transcriptional regulator [Bacteriovoracaceae bacterium]|nr:TraR/DksA family transcriptional regulator [Bacteriovoracaceae bacterium]
MKKTEKEAFKNRLLELKQEVLNNDLSRDTEDLKISSDDLPDEADIAASVINQQVTFGLRDRNLNKLRRIEEALYKVDQGTYGVCEECDEPIGSKRLERQPFATLCITHAEELERENRGRAAI